LDRAAQDHAGSCDYAVGIGESDRMSTRAQRMRKMREMCRREKQLAILGVDLKELRRSIKSWP
jgi:hypothetical protein